MDLKPIQGKTFADSSDKCKTQKIPHEIAYSLRLFEAGSAVHLLEPQESKVKNVRLKLTQHGMCDIVRG